MAQQLLDSADVVPGFQQVGGETVPKGVTGDPGIGQILRILERLSVFGEVLRAAPVGKS